MPFTKVRGYTGKKERVEEGLQMKNSFSERDLLAHLFIQGGLNARLAEEKLSLSRKQFEHLWNRMIQKRYASRSLHLQEWQDGRKVYRSLVPRRHGLPDALSYFQHAKSLQRTSQDGGFGKRVQQAGQLFLVLKSLPDEAYPVHRLLDEYEAVYGDGEQLLTRGVIERALAFLNEYGVVERQGTLFRLLSPFFEDLSDQHIYELSFFLHLITATTTETVPAYLALSALETLETIEPVHFEQVTTPHGLLYEALIFEINDAIAKNRMIHVQIGHQPAVLFSPAYVFHDFEDGRKNVIGFTGERLWSFRIDRLAAIEQTNIERELHPFTQAFRIPTTARPETLILQFHLETVSLSHRVKLRARLERETSHLIKHIEDVGSGWRFSCSICDPFATLPWIKSFGSLVEILQPLPLRQRMVEQLQTMQTRYTEVER